MIDKKADKKRVQLLNFYKDGYIITSILVILEIQCSDYTLMTCNVLFSKGGVMLYISTFNVSALKYE